MKTVILRINIIVVLLVIILVFIVFIKRADSSCISYLPEEIKIYPTVAVKENASIELKIRNYSLGREIKVKRICVSAKFKDQVKVFIDNKRNENLFEFFRLALGDNHYFDLRIEWSDGQSVSLQNVASDADFFIRHPDNNPAKDFDLTFPIAKTLGYFKGVQQYEIATLLMLDSLSSTFHLKGFEKLSSTYQGIVSQAQGDILNILSVNWRMINREKTVSKEAFKSLSGVDLLTMPALHCDYLGLPDNMAEKWLEALTNGGYQATHAALGYKWSVDNQCLVQNLPDDFSSKVSNTLTKLIDSSDGLNDLEIESMCFLLLLDREDLFMQKWLTVLLNQQNPDGGWSPELDISDSAQHTSALAACVLFDLHYYNMSFSTLPSKYQIINK